MRAFVGLGANLDQPGQQVQAALDLLGKEHGIRGVRPSRLYRSAPLGPQPQPDYCNAVCELESELWPLQLLDRLKAIEEALGREPPAERWGPRRIDLDLLFMPRLKLKWPGLTLPHPEAHRRNFVMSPLAELDPDLDWPGFGPVAALASALGNAGLALWSGQ